MTRPEAAASGGVPVLKLAIGVLVIDLLSLGGSARGAEEAVNPVPSTVVRSQEKVRGPAKANPHSKRSRSVRPPACSDELLGEIMSRGGGFARLRTTDDLRTWGDTAQYANFVAAHGVLPRREFTRLALLNLATVYTLKALVRRERPSSEEYFYISHLNANADSMPSGHAAVALGSAFAVAEKFGFRTARPLLLVGVWTAASRLEEKMIADWDPLILYGPPRHRLDEVLASALIGWTTAAVLVKPSPEDCAPQPDSVLRRNWTWHLAAGRGSLEFVMERARRPSGPSLQIAPFFGRSEIGVNVTLGLGAGDRYDETGEAPRVHALAQTTLEKAAAAPINVQPAVAQHDSFSCDHRPW